MGESVEASLLSSPGLQLHDHQLRMLEHGRGLGGGPSGGGVLTHFERFEALFEAIAMVLQARQVALHGGQPLGEVVVARTAGQ